MRRLLVLLVVAAGCSETSVQTPDDDDDTPALDDDDVAPDDDDAAPDDDDAAPTCPSDPFEPNDDAGGATETPPTSYPGLHACLGDEDWYRFDLGHFDTFLVDAFFDSSEGDVDLFIYDEQGTLVASSTATEGDEHLVYAVPAEGTYYAVVALTEDRGATEGVEYLLNLQVDPAYCLEDPWEPNPTFSQPAFVFPHPWWNQVVCPDDEDWDETARWAGPLLQIWAWYDPAEGEIHMSLHNGADGALLMESSGGGGEHYVEWELEDGPPYSFRIWQESDTGRWYGNVYDMLMLQTYPDGCFSDAYEFNDGQGWAWPIGNGLHPGLQACSSDADWFKIRGTTGDVLEIEVAHDAAEGDVSVALTDGAGAPLLAPTLGPGIASFSYAVPATGDVFVEVASTSDTGAVLGTPYTLAVSGQSPTCYPDTWEPNGGPGTASGLGLEPYVAMTMCGDDDWYNRLVVQDDTLTITVNHDPADGALALRLRDAAGGVIAESLAGMGAETVSYTANVTRFVFVELEYLGDTGGPPGLEYDMVVSVQR